MKRKISMIALALALIFCAGLLTGCTSSTKSSGTTSTTTSSTTDTSSSDTEGDGTDEDTTTEEGTGEDDTETEDGGESQDLIGEVSYAGTSSLTLLLYETEADVTDYASLDLSTLTDAGKTSSVTIQEDAAFFYTDSGEEYSAAQEDVVEGSVISVTTTDSGTQKIVILNYQDMAAEPEETIVAMVDAVNEDGTLSLSLYTLTADAADYVITDPADVDLGNYEASDETLEYEIGEETLIQVLTDGVLEEAAATDIAAGDMLVIGTDDSGSETIIIYRTEAGDSSDSVEE